MPYRRFLTKAIIWEILSNILGGLIVWFFSGQLILATIVTLFTMPAKLILYVIHEIFWSHINWDRK